MFISEVGSADNLSRRISQCSIYDRKKNIPAVSKINAPLSPSLTKPMIFQHADTRGGKDDEDFANSILALARIISLWHFMATHTYFHVRYMYR